MSKRFTTRYEKGYSAVVRCPVWSVEEIDNETKAVWRLATFYGDSAEVDAYAYAVTREGQSSAQTR